MVFFALFYLNYYMQEHHIIFNSCLNKVMTAIESGKFCLLNKDNAFCIMTLWCDFFIKCTSVFKTCIWNITV